MAVKDASFVCYKNVPDVVFEAHLCLTFQYFFVKSSIGFFSQVSASTVLVLNKRLLFFPVVLEATDSSLRTVAMMPKFVYLLVQKATNFKVWGAVFLHGVASKQPPGARPPSPVLLAAKQRKITLIMRTNVALRKTMMANKKEYFSLENPISFYDVISIFGFACSLVSWLR